MHSYCLAEALILGAVPVVTSDFVPPFSPELDGLLEDWCLIIVSEAWIVPDIGRGIHLSVRHEMEEGGMSRTD